MAKREPVTFSVGDRVRPKMKWQDLPSGYWHDQPESRRRLRGVVLGGNSDLTTFTNVIVQWKNSDWDCPDQLCHESVELDRNGLDVVFDWLDQAIKDDIQPVPDR